MHPAIRDALERNSVTALLQAWRDERTSELADAYVFLADVHPTLRDLARRIEISRYKPTWKFDPASQDARAREWTKFTALISNLRKDLPDPRVGRELERTIALGNSDNWFRPDQVAHVITSFPKTSDEESFADIALALVEAHADAGTADRIERDAEHLLVEAACNEAEMSERLRKLAIELRARYPNDVILSEATRGALLAHVDP